MNAPAPGGRRRQLCGAAEVAAALCANEPVQLVLHRAGPLSPEAEHACAEATRRGIPCRSVSARQLARLAHTESLAGATSAHAGAPPTPAEAGGPGENGTELLALVGPAPRARLTTVLEGADVVWLLAGTAYPGNAGFVMRTAEVSGADAVVIDADFDHEQKRAVRRAAMRADRYMPVFYETAAHTLSRARAAGLRCLAIEDSGDRAPWEIDLVAPALFVVGGERHGVPPDVLAACNAVVRLPMGGFVPSYNLQAAMAMVAGERLRQCARAAPV